MKDRIYIRLNGITKQQLKEITKNNGITITLVLKAAIANYLINNGIVTWLNNGTIKAENEEPKHPSP